jgi:hypothetical protein
LLLSSRSNNSCSQDAASAQGAAADRADATAAQDTAADRADVLRCCLPLAADLLLYLVGLVEQLLVQVPVHKWPIHKNINMKKGERVYTILNCLHGNSSIKQYRINEKYCKDIFSIKPQRKLQAKTTLNFILCLNAD